MLEGLLRSYHTMYDLPYVALRYFNVYGPRMDIHGKYTEVLIRWIDRIAEGRPPLILGDGHQTMDFVYIDDVIDALEVAALARHVDREVINIGSGEETSIESLPDLIGRLTHNQVMPLRNTSGGGVKRLWANIGKAHALLNYQPKVSLAEGLRLTIERDQRFSLSHRDTAPLPEKRFSADARTS